MSQKLLLENFVVEGRVRQEKSGAEGSRDQRKGKQRTSNLGGGLVHLFSKAKLVLI